MWCGEEVGLNSERLRIFSQARRAMQEQLAKNKELTQKVCMELEGDKEVCVAEEGLLPDSLNEVQPSRNVANPWMLGKLSNETKDSGTQEDLKAPADLKEPESEGEEEPVLSEEEALLQDFEQRRWVRHGQKGCPELQGEYLRAQQGVWEFLSLLPLSVTRWTAKGCGCCYP